MPWVDHTDGLGKVSEDRRVVQVQGGRGVVTQHPGELGNNNNNNNNGVLSGCSGF